MPAKDREKRLAYQRAWYNRPENRARTIERTKDYRRTSYAGVCVNCGDATHGDRPSKVPGWCSKPDCASAQRTAGSIPAFLLQECLRLAQEVTLAEEAREIALSRLKEQTKK